MTKQIIHVPDAPRPIAPYSPAIIANGLIFVSGQIPLNPQTGQMMQETITAETHQVMQNVAAVLEAAGSNWNRVVKATIFLTSMSDYAVVNEIYGQYFDNETAPARECVQVSKLPKDAHVEISVIALPAKQVFF
jgi:2-iminobutanoate/2-iminopropanoate deaminase